MLKIFLHDQIKILLERMDTHPEEFIRGRKWEDFLPVSSGNPVITPRFKHFTKLEQYLIRKKYESLVTATLRQRAYDSILETLVFKEETNTERYYSTSNQPVLGTPSYTVSTSEHIKLHQEALHQAAKKLYKTSS